MTSDGHDIPRDPAVRTIAMPKDTNPSGDIFGGWIMAQMDVAGGVTAAQRARGRVVTVACDAMTFHRPVFVGDVVSCYAEIVRIGSTSITVKVEAVAARYTSNEKVKVTEATFTYVAIGADRKKRVVPAE